MDTALTTWSPAVRVGRWWFKNRSLSPLPFFILMIVLKPAFVLGGPQIAVVVAGILLSEALRIWAVGYAGSVTRTRGDNIPDLIHAGPYRWMRNPLYVANIFLYSLTGVLYGFGWLSLFLFLYSIIQYNFIIRFEEQRLFEIFGESYRKYFNLVPRWPLILGEPYPDSGHTFGLAKAIRSERSTLLLMGAMGAVFVVKKMFF